MNFVPGGAKYGDVPALLALCAPIQTTVVGETRGSVAGLASAFAAAKGQVEFVVVTQSAAVDAVVNALTGQK